MNLSFRRDKDRIYISIHLDSMPVNPIETEGLIACIAVLFIYCEEAVVSRSMGPPMAVDSSNK